MLPVPCVQICPLGFCIATLSGHVISLGITMISSSHHSQCSIKSHSVFSIYLIAKIFKKFYLLIWLCQVLVVAYRIFSCSLWAISCSMWDLVPCLEIKARSPALGAQSLNHWTTREFLQWMFKAIRPGGFTQEASVDGEGQGWTGRLPCWQLGLSRCQWPNWCDF